MTDRREAERRKSPAFQMYPKDWLSSEDVTLMPPEAEGLFIRLLMISWDNNGLPTNPEGVKELAGRKYARCWARAWPPVRKKFVERNGRLVNPRQEIEREKQRTRAAQAKEAAELRWEEERQRREAAAGRPVKEGVGGANAYPNASGSHALPHMPTPCEPASVSHAPAHGLPHGPEQCIAVASASAVAGASASAPPTATAAARDPRALDYVTRCCVAVNRVLEQQLAGAYAVLVPNVERATAKAWEAAGIPIDVAEQVLAELAARFPNERGRQPQSLGYFTAALHEAHSKQQAANGTATRAPTSSADRAKATLERMEREANTKVQA